MVSSIVKARELLQNKWGGGWSILSTEEYARVPFFGNVIKQSRNVNGKPVEYYNILRHFGWSVTFGVTEDHNVLTLIQWKPGVNQASWELPPGGIGKIEENTSRKTILKKTQEVYLNETGYGNGAWQYLGYVMIETGKYRGATPDSHGFRAHMWLARNLKSIKDVSHAPEEMIEVFPVPLQEFREVLESGLFVEESSVAGAYKALIKLGLLSWVNHYHLRKDEIFVITSGKEG
ncbi:MAG: hypothetical protein A3H64_02020 [Candidatus Ryanbacteria bacterium RIFCSPLOWO2_02_FULL_45_11c]|uniref:Nudix hydrolase domain-containing protein n=1 Tax=Candidatus Ryanbacteria bacterium RIFCSPLOWO2_02_FULL_45_11c TaxID=1802128 RepID=A0A1G2H2H7_9BACT|nr:MAG: hypothetical protein A3H64_02020 [Candidatus Ryanbacteria bacterium RIFCSPLOWO2_02_FULL_45_11c]